jgi:carbon storage regulator
MLVLTRKENQSIVIGEEIEIKIARINKSEVRVGITAPRYIPIFRKEIAPSLRCDDEYGNKARVGNLIRCRL